MTRLTRRGLAVLSIAFIVTACAQPGWDPTAEQEARDAIAAFKSADPKLDTFFKKSHGYAVFPTVAKGGAGVGAAYGEGTVFERGRVVGFSALTKVSLGLQLGGQSYRQVIFFEDKATLEEFRGGDYTLDAGASAVAVEDGTASAADYDAGVAVFTMTKAGLMAEAAVGGQRFTFKPK